MANQNKQINISAPFHAILWSSPWHQHWWCMVVKVSGWGWDKSAIVQCKTRHEGLYTHEEVQPPPSKIHNPPWETNSQGSWTIIVLWLQGLIWSVLLNRRVVVNMTRNLFLNSFLGNNTFSPESHSANRFTWKVFASISFFLFPLLAYLEQKLQAVINCVCRKCHHLSCKSLCRCFSFLKHSPYYLNLDCNGWDSKKEGSELINI